jgi:Beta-lactamase enzyme family
VAGNVLVDPADGCGPLRHGRGPDPRDPPGPPACARIFAAVPGAAAVPGTRRSPSLRRAAALLALIVLSAPLAARAPAPLSKLESSAELDAFLAAVAKETVEEFSKSGLTADGLSIAVIDLTAGRSAGPYPFGGYRAEESSYPCSVVKLCFLSYYEAQKEAGRIADNPELVRAVRDMITVSSNDATGFVVDSITGTTSGPEIADTTAWKAWQARRNAVNDWYRARGYTHLNADQKTFCEDAYGREQAFREGGKNRNRMSAAEAARILKEIVRGEVAGERLTAEMFTLLSRDITAEKPLEDTELEDARLAGRGLPPGSRLWSKSGDAYDYHHLVGLIALPNGSEIVLAVFTKGVKDVPGIIPRVFERVAAHFAPLPRG